MCVCAWVFVFLYFVQTEYTQPCTSISVRAFIAKMYYPALYSNPILLN